MKMMHKYFLILLLSLISFVAEAQTLVQNNLVSVCSTGNPKNIADFCLNHVKKELRKTKLNESNLPPLLDDKDLQLTCWMGRYFASLKWKGTFVASELKDLEFTRWLLDNPQIFEKLVFANHPNAQSLGILYRIRSKEGGKLPGPLLNLALGASLCANWFPAEECIARFDFYKNSYEKKLLFPQFETLEPWECVLLLRDTESVQGGMETLAWGQNFIANKKKITPDNLAARACGFTPYRDKNKEGISIHKGSAFYDHKPTTLQIYNEYGGVCGGVSKAACGYLKSKGIPAYTVGQPGHCAFVWKRTNGKWSVGNDIYGWVRSEGNPNLPWKGTAPIILQLSKFIQNNPERSTLCLYLAEYADNKDLLPLFVKQALEESPENYPAWKLWVTQQVKQASETKKKEIALLIKEKLSDSFAIYDLIYNNIPFNWNQTNPYDICSLLLDEEESLNGRFLFMRQLKLLVFTNIQDIKKFHNEERKDDFVTSWKSCASKKPSLKTKRQSCIVLQETLARIAGKQKTYSQFLELYDKFLMDWKDKTLMADADQFIRKQLGQEQHPDNKKALIKLGMQITEFTGDKKGSQFYVDASLSGSAQEPQIQNN